MSKFVVIYTSPESVQAVVAAMDPAAEAASTQAWLGWAGRAGEHLIDFGAPVGPGKHISQSGVTDAPAGVGGYSFLEAESVDEAVTMMDGHPQQMGPDASIQVYEVLAAPGM